MAPKGHTLTQQPQATHSYRVTRARRLFFTTVIAIPPVRLVSSITDFPVRYCDMVTEKQISGIYRKQFLTYARNVLF